MLMLEIHFQNQATYQMVHISNNASGLYLSETALKELGLIHPRFPDVAQPSHSSSANLDINSTDEAAMPMYPQG